MDRDDDTPPPMLFDPSREDPRAKEWADREVQYVQEIAHLKAQLSECEFKLSNEINQKAKLALELNRLRRGIFTAGKKE